MRRSQPAQAAGGPHVSTRLLRSTLARRKRLLRKRWPVGATLFTVILVGLVALALAGQRSWWFIDALIVIVVAATAYFHLSFPSSRFLAVAFANSMAAYACVFNLFVEANFTGVRTPILILGFALPILAFCLAASLRRQRVRAVI